MANPQSSQPINGQELRNFVETQSDFAFEMEVLRLALREGLRCEHSGTYIDPITGKIREFDIRAYFEAGNTSLALAIECKNLRPTRPLLISCMPRTDAEAFHEILRWNGVASPVPFRIETLSCLYAPKDMVGKKMDQVSRSTKGELSSDDQETFEKSGQAISSCHDLIRNLFWHHARNPNHIIQAVAPVMVVPDGMLWQVDYADDGSVQQYPRQVASVTRFIAHAWKVTNTLGQELRYRLSHLNIVCVSELPGHLGLWCRPGGFFPLG